MVISVNFSLLNNYYLSKAGILAGSTSSTVSTTTSTSSRSSTPAAPSPPWDATTPTPATTLASQAEYGQNVINPNAKVVSNAAAGSDYQALFTLYQGLNTLEGMTEQMLASGASTTGNAQIAKAFNTGMGQVTSYVNGLQLKNMRISTGSVSSSSTTTVAPSDGYDTTYTTGVVFSGDQNSPVPALEGDVQFGINIKKYNGQTVDIPIDLSQMNSTPRTVPNVVSYINSQLAAAGVITRFATDLLPSSSNTIQVGSQTVTLPAGPEQWALKINGDSEEAVTFTADPTTATAPAVYVTQTAGNTLPVAPTTTLTNTSNGLSTTTSTTSTTTPVQQLLKFQADASDPTTPPPAAQAQPGTTNATSDQVFNKTLDPNVTAVKATATGPDGSVYMVADVDGTIDGQPLEGSSDVALLKYDSSGNLQYAQTLGAASNADGYSIAVNSDGKVAVAGSFTGALDANDPGNVPGTTDSFVSLYDNQGNELWTQTSAGGVTNNQINSVAFGANDTVYVGGQANFTTDTAQSYGAPTGFIAGYSAKGAQTFETTTAGLSDVSGIAVDGSTLVAAGTNGGDAVVNSYTLPATTGGPTLTATQDLGNLAGGAVAGVAINNGEVVVAGNSANGSLNAGTVTSAATGGQNAFVAQLSESSLTPDQVAYFGAAGTTLSGLTVSGGQVYTTGSTSGGFNGQPVVGSKEGYVAAVDVGSGSVTWSQTFTAQDGYSAPESVAVAQGGASVLDALGLPTQTLSFNTTPSQLLTTATSVRAGDQFEVRTSAGATPVTVTISADDTPDSLAEKIQQATGFNVTVQTVTLNGQNELQISAANDHSTVELLPGPAGQDALAPLGLAAGVIQTPSSLNAGSVASSSPTGIAKNTYGLNLPASFDLTTTAGIQAAQTAIKSAMAKVQTAYYGLASPSTTSTTTGGVQNNSANNKVPAYLQAELANYQAGLTRLTGSTSTSSGLSALL